MWLLGAVKMSGKTTALQKNNLTTITDKLVCSAVYGYSDDVGADRFMYTAANSPYITRELLRRVDSHDKNVDMFGWLDQSEPISDILNFEHLKQISVEDAANLINSGSYFRKQGTAYVNTKLSKIGMQVLLDKRVAWFVLTHEGGSFLFGIRPSEFKVGESDTLKIVFSAFSIETIEVGFKTELCPLVVSEGYIAPAYEYVSPALAQQVSDRYAPIDAAYKVLADEYARFWANQIILGVNPADMSVKQQIAHLSGAADAESNKQTQMVMRALAREYEQVLTWVHMRHNMTFDEFHNNNSMRQAIGFACDGSGPRTVTTPCVAFQFSCRGTLMIDSLLSYVYSPSSQPLPGALSSDVVTAAASSTFKPILATYGELGERDPLKGYDLAPLLSGAVHALKAEDGVHFNGDLYVSTRLDGRSKMVKFGLNGFIFDSANVFGLSVGIASDRTRFIAKEQIPIAEFANPGKDSKIKEVGFVAGYPMVSWSEKRD